MLVWMHCILGWYHHISLLSKIFLKGIKLKRSKNNGFEIQVCLVELDWIFGIFYALIWADFIKAVGKIGGRPWWVVQLGFYLKVETKQKERKRSKQVSFSIAPSKKERNRDRQMSLLESKKEARRRVSFRVLLLVFSSFRK